MFHDGSGVYYSLVIFFRSKIFRSRWEIFFLDTGVDIWNRLAVYCDEKMRAFEWKARTCLGHSRNFSFSPIQFSLSLAPAHIPHRAQTKRQPIINSILPTILTFNETIFAIPSLTRNRARKSKFFWNQIFAYLQLRPKKKSFEV